LVLCRPPDVVFVELKTNKGRVSEHQKKWLEALGECPGVRAYCWRPADWELVESTLKKE
jgi:hypothetical protein